MTPLKASMRLTGRKVLRLLPEVWRTHGPLAVVGAACRLAQLRAWSWLGRPTLTRRIHGSRMALDVRDRAVSWQLAIFGTREPLETDLVKREVSAGMAVVDVGANIGYYTLLCAARGAFVHAIEPSPSTFALLSRNVSLNGYETRVTLYNVALADGRGRRKLYLAATPNCHSLVGTGPSIEVEALALPDLGLRAIDFLRMDLEGGERMVIDGMGACRPHRMLIELHPHPDLPARLQKLARMGYRCRWAVTRTYPQQVVPFDLADSEIPGTGAGLPRTILLERQE